MKREQNRNTLRQEPEIMLAVANARIAWVLDHSYMSDWLKQALWTVKDADPVAVQNDVEMLRHLLAPRAQAQIELSLSGTLIQKAI